MFNKIRFILCTGFMISLLSVPVQAETQDCFSSWTRPVVCGVKMAYSVEGGEWKSVYPGSRIEVSMGKEVAIEFRAIDQRGYDFPEDRFTVQIERGWSFDDYFQLVEIATNRVTLQSKGRKGKVSVTFWMPGNLNFEWDLDFDIRGLQEFSAKQSEYIVTCLYRAILERDPDSSGFTPAVMEVQRGRLEEQVKSMFKSGEFNSRIRGKSATKLLDTIYVGLLNRKPDSAGVRDYLSKIEKRKYADVVIKIIQSEEFQTRLLKIH
ncbi:MAG TPA: DUF4214 domain-containing protein [Thermoanaerobaculia bacterium]|nr:DUF4214 domain-containing protein [Thermoanaerobaculia bacterium]HUM29894.1 DUF4214 domain-containing protein [Thermoanaerobaculia bacterium]HXK68239.1 DUF4214 domain-containing protein [Thermoanaerobaculia bacterium]